MNTNTIILFLCIIFNISNWIQAKFANISSDHGVCYENP